MSKVKKGVSAFFAVHKIAEAFRREFRFGKVLNMMAKNWAEWREIVEIEMSKEIRTDQVSKMNQFLNFMGWLLTIPVKNETGDGFIMKKRPRFKLIKSMLPTNSGDAKTERSPKELLKQILEGVSMLDLKLSDLEKVELIEVSSRHGGIKPHRVSVIIWGIHNQLINILGDAWTMGDLTEEKVLEATKAYHAKRGKRREKREKKAQEKEQSVETDSSDEFIAETYVPEIIEKEDDAMVTFQKLVDGELSVSELSVELLEPVRQLATGAIKGALTRRINAQ